MRLARDLWSAAPGRLLALSALLLVKAGARAAVALFAGSLLVERTSGWFAALAGAAVIATAADLYRDVLAVRLFTDWSAATRTRLCHRALGQGLPALEDTPVGELLDRVDSDVEQMQGELRTSGVVVVESFVGGMVALITAFAVWWPAGLAMVATGAVVVATLRSTAMAMPSAREREEEAWSDLAAVTEEAVHGQDDVRTSLARPYVVRLTAERSAELLRRGRVAWRLSTRLFAGSLTITRLALAVIVIGGTWTVASGRLDGARLTTTWLLGTAFVMTAEEISRHTSEVLMALGAWSRVVKLTDAPQEPVGGVEPTPGPLEVRSLTFRYPTDGRRAALHDIDLTFEPGRSYAVVGRTGSGKSTLAKALTRSVEVPPGTVFLNGTDVTTLDLEALRRTVALVPQSTELVAGTLADNVTLFDPDLRPLVGVALDQLGLMPWVAGLPDGIETRLGEGGHVLSAGQAQLVAFARILIRQPAVVILDEATARLDPATEQRVRRATRRLLEGRIGILIAHRLATVEECDDIVVLAGGAVTETGPLRGSAHIADLLQASRQVAVAVGADAAPPRPDRPAPAPADDRPDDRSTRTRAGTGDGAGARRLTDPPSLPPTPPARTLPEVARLALNDSRFGLASATAFLLALVVALDGAVLPWLFAAVVDDTGSPWGPAVVLAAGLAVGGLPPWYYQPRFPEWWVRQMLRINLRLVHGQTGPRRISRHSPAEVVAQAGDTERVVILADHLYDQAMAVFALLLVAVMTRSVAVAGLFVLSMGLSGLIAALFRRQLTVRAERVVTARARFATTVTSALAAARSIKLAGASRPVLTELARLDRIRTGELRRELVWTILARSTPSLVAGLAPVAAWGLYTRGSLGDRAVLVAAAALPATHWYGWTTASLVSRLPSARVWTARTVSMAGVANYSAPVDGVDLSAGTAPGPPLPARSPLRLLELVGIGAVHDDGTIAVADVDLTVERGQLVLIIGSVGSGKSSLLRALAGIVHHTGELRWNGDQITEPEVFLRPHQVGYVGQLPRVLSGTIADNVALGHRLDVAGAVDAAQLGHDLAVSGSGLDLVIGHKATRLSGGQLQRLALARALASDTELLVADDVSSALDVATELDLWRTLRARGVTTIASTSRLAAVVRADLVVVLDGGRAVDQGRWDDLVDRWGHLAA